MMYYFYFNDLLMPVTPGSMKLSIKNRNKTISLVSGGEINILKDPGLTEISFDLLIPSAEYSFARYENGFKSPNYFLETFESLKKNRLAFNFVVIRSMTAEMLLRNAAKLNTLPDNIWREYDFDADGKITAADARILLRNQSGLTILSNTNMKCAIEDYSITEDAEKYGRDFLVSMKLKQCPDYSLKTAVYSVTK